MLEWGGGLGLMLRAAQLFNLPSEIVSGVARVEITGTGEAVIENHSGLLEYSASDIVVSGGKAVIRVRGDGLEIRSISEDELVIRGLILNVEFLL